MHGNQLHVISDVYESILHRAQEVKVEERKVNLANYESHIACLGQESMERVLGMQVGVSTSYGV